MWELYSSIRSWPSRHKRVIQCAAVVGTAAAGYVLYQKLSPIVSELVSSYKLLRQMEKDLDGEREKQNNERLQHQFEQTRHAARLALSHICLELRDRFDQLFEISVLRERLRQKSEEGSRAEVRLDEFKIAVISRTLSMLYCLSLCSVVLRLQLCIAARYAACVEGNPNQHNINSEFLGLVQAFSGQGAENIANVVRLSVSNFSSSIGMQTVVDRRTFEVLMDDICTEISKNIVPDCSKFLIPILNDAKADHILSQMRLELIQLLSSQSINIVFKASLQVAFESLEPVYEVFSGEGRSEVVFGRTLPKFANVFEQTVPKHRAEAESSSLLTALSLIPELNDFSSIVFFPIGHNANRQSTSAIIV